MEPLSALAIASGLNGLSSTAFAVAKSILALAKDSKSINITIQDLATEVHQVGEACQMVKAELSEQFSDGGGTVNNQAGDTERRRMYEVVKRNVDACSNTIRRLGQAVPDRRERSNPLRNALRQMRLNMSMEQITHIRGQVQSHVSGLQTCLLVVSMYV